jgi:hypothetical protein
MIVVDIFHGTSTHFARELLRGRQTSPIEEAKETPNNDGIGDGLASEA